MTDATAYEVNIPLSTSHYEMDNAAIFSSNLWALTGPEACYKSFPTNSNFQIVNTPSEVTAQFDSVSYEVTLQIEDTTAKTINSGFTVTT